MRRGASAGPRREAGDYVVIVNAQDGHAATARVPASRFGGAEAAAAPAAAPAGPPCRPRAPRPRIEALVAAAVQREMLPLLERIEAMDSRLRFTDVAVRRLPDPRRGRRRAVAAEPGRRNDEPGRSFRRRRRAAATEPTRSASRPICGRRSIAASADRGRRRRAQPSGHGAGGPRRGARARGRPAGPPAGRVRPARACRGVSRSCSSSSCRSPRPAGRSSRSARFRPAPRGSRSAC